MDRTNYNKLKTRLSGAIYNAINKDPQITFRFLRKAFFEVCYNFISKKKLVNDLPKYEKHNQYSR